MGYLFLLLTILSESAAVFCMKLSSGFQNKTAAFISIACYAGSFIFLTYSLKYLPAGIANAIWAGASAILVALLGIFFLNEKINLLQMISLVLIVFGLIGLHVFREPGQDGV